MLTRAQSGAPEAPKTWYDMAPAIGVLADAGQACGYVTASPARILLENAGAWPEDSRVAFDNVMVRWVAMLASWQRSGYFSYALIDLATRRAIAVPSDVLEKYSI